MREQKILPASHPSLRRKGAKPLSAALQAAGATAVPQYDFRMLRERGGAEYSVADPHFGHIFRWKPNSRAYLQTLSADTALGYLHVTYQISVVDVTKCDAGMFPPAGFEGTVAKARNAPKTDSAEGAKVD